jgi:hypothetical protein
MKKNKILLLILLFPLLSIAQENFITTQFSNYRKSVIQEKLLISTDRPAYVEEEIIWFKLYVVDANFHQPLTISKVAYVELLDQNDSPVLQAKIDLKNGLGSGSFQIPKEISSGKYHLRAYTNWMKNFDSALFYNKELIIVGNASPVVGNLAPRDFDIQFFPEGGVFLSGVKTKMAYKILNENGIGENLNGVVINNDRDTIARISGGKYGMGSFMVEAKTDDKLTVIFKNSKGTALKRTLPKPSLAGITMNLNRSSGGLITVHATLKNYTSKAVTLLAQTRNQICISQTKTFVNGMASFSFNENSLKEGISQITLFDEFNNPVCERLYFRKPKNTLALTTTLDHSSYSKRTQVTLDLKTTENANVSVSVYKADELNSSRSDNLSTYLWLGAELGGIIEHSAFYLDQAIENNIEADNLMLTQGWRRFKWKDILNNNAFKPIYAPEYQGLTINTSLSSPHHIKTFATVMETVPKTYFAKADHTGKSSFLANFYGKKTLIFQTDPMDDSVSKFNLINPFVVNDQPNRHHLTPFNSLTNFSTRYTAAQVQARYHTSKYLPVVEHDLNIQAVPTVIYNIDEYTKFPDVKETIKEYIKGVSTYKRNDKQQLRISYKNDLNYLDYMSDDALVLFDGIPDFNYNDILTYKTANIDQIAVIQEKYFDNDINFGGVFLIKSKDRDLRHFKSPNALIIDYEGLQLERVFYTPQYATDGERNSKLPDFRNLLYWNANVNLKLESATKINFSTADQTGKYIGIIEGLTDSGKVGHQVISFEVK